MEELRSPNYCSAATAVPCPPHTPPPLSSPFSFLSFFKPIQPYISLTSISETVTHFCCYCYGLHGTINYLGLPEIEKLARTSNTKVRIFPGKLQRLLTLGLCHAISGLVYGSIVFIPHFVPANSSQHCSQSIPCAKTRSCLEENPSTSYHIDLAYPSALFLPAPPFLHVPQIQCVLYSLGYPSYI